MIEDAGVREAGARVAEAALIAAIGKVLDLLIGQYKERRTSRKDTADKLADLHKRIAKLEGKKP